jgi:hypothetical protein
MTYKVIDFRSLVTIWYNEFLPEKIGQNKSVFVEDADILYLKPISLESIRKDTLKFLRNRVSDMVDGCVGWVVQEPKPVNNVRIQPLLQFLEGMKDMSRERRDKVLHFANRRYVPLSENIMVSQDKEIDEFLDSVFKELAKLKIPNVKLYPIQSLGMADFVDSARGFLPRKALSIQSEIKGEHIQVRSTNEMLEQLKSYVVNANFGDSAMAYVERCRESLNRDLCELV